MVVDPALAGGLHRRWRRWWPGAWRRSDAGGTVASSSALIMAACGLVVATVQLRGQLTDVLDQLPTVAPGGPGDPRLRRRLAHRRRLRARRHRAWRSSSAPYRPISPPSARRATRRGSRAASTSPAGCRDRRRHDRERLDRASVWRSVPMRRGITVLGVGPGLVAMIGNMSWSSDDDPAGAGGLGRRAALRRQRLVPRRPRPALAREPARSARPGLRGAGDRAGRVRAGGVHRHARSSPASAPDCHGRPS